MPDPLDAEIEKLLRRAAAADWAAIDQLLQMHRPRLRRMVAVHMDPRLSARVDASDVVQEALLQASRKMPQYLRDRPLPFYPWLRQIAWERLVHLHEVHIGTAKRGVGREAAGRMKLPDDSVLELAERLVAHTSNPSGRVLRDEMRHRVHAALVQLSPGDRDVLVLRYLEQLQIKEIAAILGITEGAATKRHVRGLERLRNVLEGQSEQCS